MNEPGRADRAPLDAPSAATVRESDCGAQPLGAALYALAFLSGAAALTYEIAWTKLLSLTFGSTTLAASAVVGGFLGGMGIGAWLYDRLPRLGGSPLRTYAAIEVGIAVSAATLTLALEGLPALLAHVFHTLPPGGVVTLFRVSAVFVLLLVPAALMGATYPALCSSLIHSRRAVDRHLGVLYGLNTLGAAGGALLAGLVLVPAIGLRASVGIGVLVNLCVGATAFLLSRRPVGRVAAEPAHGPTALPSLLPYKLTGSVILLSGFATLSYEILWFRALRYLMGNSTFALTIILVVFLLGLGLGALPLRRVAARGRPELDLARCQLGIALLAALAIGSITVLASQREIVSAIGVFSPEFRALAWQTRLLIHGGIAVVLMLPAAFLMGLSFPLASRMFLGDVRNLGRRVGGAYLLSNLGSIAGAILAAVWLLPSLGTVGGTRLVIALNVLLGTAILSQVPLPRLRRAALVGSTLLLLGGLVWVFPDKLVFLGPHSFPGVEIVFEEEDDMGTVQVLQDHARPEQKGISIDGTIIGASGGWHTNLGSKQVLIAHLPMLLDARLSSALQIGLGSASTVEALARHGGLERIDCVEINPAVLRGSLLFEESESYEDPRVRVLVEDAIHYLVRVREPYDLIVSDGKQNADFSGNSKLLSREFYALVRSSLSPSGLFVQWIPPSLLSVDFRTVLRTISDVFPEVEVFLDPPGSIILVASAEPIAGRPRMSRQARQAGGVGGDMRRVGIVSEVDLLRRWMADRASILAAAGPGPLNSWDHAPLEFNAYRADANEVSGASAANLALLLRAREIAGADAPGFARVNAPAGRAMTALARAYELQLRGDLAGARAAARRVLKAQPQDPLARRTVRYLDSIEGKPRAQPEQRQSR